MADGELVLHESLGINLYLAKKFGGSLAPATLAEDGAMITWTLWAVTEVERHAIEILYNMAAYPPEKRNHALAEQSVAALRAPSMFWRRRSRRRASSLAGASR